VSRIGRFELYAVLFTISTGVPLASLKKSSSLALGIRVPISSTNPCWGWPSSASTPMLPASISPAPKAYGGTTWLVGTQVKATANEIFNDIQATVIQNINQNSGLVTRESEFVLALDPAHEAALTATNSFNVNVSDLLKKNFPKMKVVSAVQYGPVSTQQPQGQPSGLSLMQLIVPEIEGQRAAMPAFNAKLVAQRVVFAESSASQKMLSGTYGAVLRQTSAISSMVGI